MHLYVPSATPPLNISPHLIVIISFKAEQPHTVCHSGHGDHVEALPWRLPLEHKRLDAVALAVQHLKLCCLPGSEVRSEEDAGTGTWVCEGWRV